MNKFLEKLKNSIIGASVADAPAITTASGWQQNKDGKWIQNKPNKELADNLSTLSTMSPTHPISFITGQIIPGMVSNQYLKYLNRNYQKVFHGTKKKFALSNARTYSKDNVGFHASPTEEMARSFSGDKGIVHKFYIPKNHRIKTIDLGANDYRWLSNDVTLSKNIAYPANGDNTFRDALLRKYGITPTYNVSGSRYTGKQSVTMTVDKEKAIPLRKETWTRASKKANEQADKLMNRASGPITEKEAIKLNKDTSKIFSNNGVKVIEYNNGVAAEGNGGLAYAITDRKAIKIPIKFNELERYQLGTIPAFTGDFLWRKVGSSK